ncbi:DCST1 ligase, partial [Amia calva]|nr:DCST1 ligase [Amia calva]
MLGTQGRAYVMVFVLACLYQGPVSNIHRNVQDIAFSMGCNIELQINHSKVMWKVMIDPFKKVVQDIVDEKKKFEQEAQAVKKTFQDIREQVMGEYGYSNFHIEPVLRSKSTQEMFAAKTMLRCDYVVEEGMYRCKAWFDKKWQACMHTISIPLLNHLLCLPMTFSFLCNILKVMTPWCKDKIPVEGNFGQTYDKLNFSIERLGDDFSTSVVITKTEQQTVVGDQISQSQITEELRAAFQKKMILLDRFVDIIQILLSCSFVCIFLSAFSYARNYNRDICFDNMYITTYFRQIDARRRKLEKRYLLPLKKAEHADFIFPWSLKMHPSELRICVRMLQVIPLSFFTGTLLAIDWFLYRIFTIIRTYSYTEYSLSSSHHIEINVGGQSMMATLLRQSIGALNTSAAMDLNTNNMHCLPQPHCLSQSDYLWSTLPLLLMMLLCCVQVYSNRLRRVIAAFFFPKREKRRTLFLYNGQIRRRIFYIEMQRKRLMRRADRARVNSLLYSLCWRLGCLGRHCCVCGEKQKGECEECPLQTCKAVYCAQCWKDLGRFCFACTPFTQNISGENNSETDIKYAE